MATDIPPYCYTREKREYQKFTLVHKYLFNVKRNKIYYLISLELEPQ